ncbi:MAG: oligosaccharide flippase family protein [Dechloromonas sp.]|nr:oligosaccharide flippase family protein [Dechloromonas sp.]
MSKRCEKDKSNMIRQLRERLIKIREDGFVRSVSILVGGAVFSQAIMIIILPVLTRIYEPNDFSILAVYVSILGLFSSVACLRFEIAIPIPEDDREASGLLILALVCATGFFIISFLAIRFFSEKIISLLDVPGFEPYLWFIPFGIWFSGLFSALQFWAIRKKKFSLITKSRFSQSISAATAQIGFGFFGIGALGLVLGQLMNSSAGIIGLGLSAYQRNKFSMRFSSLQETFLKYSRYPKYSTLEALANSGNFQIPILMIASLAVGPDAGFLMLATKVMAAPMSLIGGAISQVYLSRAPEEKRQGRLGEFTLQVIGGLFRTGIGPLIFAGIIAPSVFPLIFGSEWERAGNIVSWMTPWFIMHFLSSPVSMVLHITERQKTAVFLQVIGLLLRVGSVIVFAVSAPVFITEAYAISGFFFYALYFFVVMHVTSIRLFQLVRELLKHLSGVAIWAFAGIFIKYFIFY